MGSVFGELGKGFLKQESIRRCFETSCGGIYRDAKNTFAENTSLVKIVCPLLTTILRGASVYPLQQAACIVFNYTHPAARSALLSARYQTSTFADGLPPNIKGHTNGRRGARKR